MNPSLQVAVSCVGRARTRRNAVCHSPACAADLRDGLQRAWTQSGSSASAAVAAAVIPGQGVPAAARARLSQRRNAMTGVDARSLRLALRLPMSPSPTPQPTPWPTADTSMAQAESTHAIDASLEQQSELRSSTPMPSPHAYAVARFPSPDIMCLANLSSPRGPLSPYRGPSARPPLARRRRSAVVAHADFGATIPDGWLSQSDGQADERVSPRIRVRRPSQPTVDATAPTSGPFLTVMLGELDLAGERTRIDHSSNSSATPYSLAEEGLNATHTPLWSPSSVRSHATDASASPAWLDALHRRGGVGASAWLLSPLPVQHGQRMQDWFTSAGGHLQH